MNRLHQLYQDKATIAELREYFEAAIRLKATDDLFAGLEVSHVPTAKRLLDSVWDKMEIDFGLEKKPKQTTSR